ncbi:MAG: DUF2946 family protein [Ferrovibrio sp.]|jgi:hypothetical protein|uniref:DUF2946 family protein n=1 Tax=Ferrovibrio sp. TaxID=1917215 RepID=UPI00391D5231
MARPMATAASLPHSPLRPRRAHVVVARLALLALLFHALLPLTLHAAQRVQTANGIELTVLCSTQGTRTIALKDGLPVEADPEKPLKASKTCPVCLATAQLGHAILPAALPLAVPGFATTVLYASAPDSTLASARYLPAQARAPPVS